MKKKHLLIAVCALVINAITFAQEAKFFIDIETADALSNLPSGVTNVNGTNTVRVKNTTDFSAIPNAVQTDPDATGENELFLDFHGYLKLDINTSSGFTLAYDYRRNDENDDWWLGFLTFIGKDGTDNKLEKLLIRKWSGQVNIAGTSIQTQDDSGTIGFFTNYHIVVTSSSSGDLKFYVDGVETLNIPNSVTGWNINSWTNASALLSFKGDSYDGTTVTPEPDYSSNARDARVYVDNVALFERELSSSEVTQIFTNGNDNLGVLSVDNNLLSENKINIYPNPIDNSSNFLNISSTAVKSVEIYNILGVKVVSKKVSNNQIDITSLSVGTYLLRSFDDKGKTLSNNKLIKL